METYNHYVRVDEDNYVIHGFSDAFEQPIEGDIPFKTSLDRHFSLGGKINAPLFAPNCLPLYKLENGEIISSPKQHTNEQKLNSIREKRDRLLLETDYIIARQSEEKDLIKVGRLGRQKISDLKYLEWLEYRQALRDLPSTVDVNNPVFPTKPQ